MSRRPASIRISLKARGGPTHRIELVKIPFTKRFRIRRDGKTSAKLPEGTATEVAEEIRRWLSKQASNQTELGTVLEQKDAASLLPSVLRRSRTDST